MKQIIKHIRHQKPGHFGLARSVDLHFDWLPCACISLPFYMVMNTDYKGFKTMH